MQTLTKSKTVKARKNISPLRSSVRLSTRTSKRINTTRLQRTRPVRPAPKPVAVISTPATPPTAADLWRQYRRLATREQAEAGLVTHHLPLVKTVVGRLQMSLPSHVSGEDLYSAGLVGLLDAVRHYNSKLGSSFETYARVRVRGAIFDELRRMDWVPRSVHTKAKKVQEMIKQLEQRKGRTPSNSEVAAALHLSLGDYQTLLDEIRPATFVCLDASVNHDSDDSPSQYEAITDPSQENPLDGVARREMAEFIAERLTRLPEMQRKVLALYYFEDLRLREIAETFGLTESRICQIHSQAILSLKNHMSEFEYCRN